jgi:hypothetical protein
MGVLEVERICESALWRGAVILLKNVVRAKRGFWVG